MGKGLGWAHACLLGLCLFALLTPVRAQVVTPEEEYKKLIRVDQDIQPLGEHPFGANISLYNGSLSFEQTDASLAGNGPLLQLVRTFKVQGFRSLDTSGQNGTFADWSLALPRLETMTVRNAAAYIGGQTSFVQGWEVAVGDSDNLDKRCSHFSKPPTVTMQTSDPALTPWTPDQWWKGYHMVIPGQGSQDLLENQDGGTQANYPVVTKNRWRFSCLSSVANVSSTDTNGDMPNPVGEGFLGIAPDGTKYWFNELVYRYAPGMSRPLSDDGITNVDSRGKAHETWFESQRSRLGHLLAWLSGSADAIAVPAANSIPRTEASLLVTKIEDRFGNTLTYNYNTQGYLTAIKDSDGRELTVQYESESSSQIKSVTLTTSSGTSRTWHYIYSSDNATLTAVTLPSGHQWHYDLAGFDSMRIVRGTVSSCSTLGADTVSQSAVTGSITHPSGLKGSFTVKPIRHGQWWGNPTDPEYQPVNCIGEQYRDPNTNGSHVTIPYAWYSFTVTQKILSGAGLPLKNGQHSETWKFSYKQSTQTWADHTCTGSCAATTWTNVANPDGSTLQYTFSNKFDHSESHLLGTDYYAGAATGTPLRSVTNTYASPDTAPFPARAGGVVQDNVNASQISKYAPLQTRTIYQNGDTYTWKAEAFDKYTHVTKTKRYNSITGQIPVEEATTYLNDTTKWVLGLPLKHTNLTTDEVISENFYNTNDLLTSRKHFGQTVMSYMWNAAGQLVSFTDANSHTTTLDNYEHGIPQTIDYPDGTSQSLTVNDLGQIASITNQAGQVTGYTYDAAGRLTKIAYPKGWNPETFQYQYVASAERGLDGGHWKRTVSQGDARYVTFYDALLRPVLTDTSIAGDSNSHISASTTYNWKGLTIHASWPVSDSPALGTSAFAPGIATTYDALGRVTAVSQHSEPDPQTQVVTITTTKTAYLSGARKQVTDTAGHVTTTSYQVFDTPSYKAVTQVTAPEDIVQSITRNLYGAPMAITQSGSDGQGGSVSITKHLYYDAQHRLCRTKEPETGSTLMGYDAAGNLAWSAEGQAVSGSGCGSAPTASRTTRAYDAMNRLLDVTHSDGSRHTTFTYDALGHVLQAKVQTVNASVTWDDTYDNMGHLTEEELGIDGHQWAINYTYDHYGHVSMLTYPDGKQVAYAPDALGRPAKAGAYATNVSYFPDGTLKYFLYMGGQDSYLATRNVRHLLKNLTVGNGSTFVYSADFTYDQAGNITVIDDLTDDRRDKTLSYDALNRLTKATAPNLWDTETYTYDALNNIRQLGAHTYTYDAENHLTAIKNGSTLLHDFTYNAQGDIIEKDSQTRDFDEAHRLLAIPGVASYVYDAAGRRVKKIDAGGSTIYYAYNGAGHLMYQWQAATGMATDYIYLGKKLVAKVKRNQGDAVLNAPGVGIDTNPNNGSFTVSWSSISNASYTLQEQTNGGNWHAAYSGTVTQKAETGKAGGSYRYRVRACDGSCSDWGMSAVVGVTPVKPAISVPTGIQSSRYTVSWNRPLSTASFDVQEQANGGTWQTIASDTTATSVSMAGDQDGSYAYRVRASSAYGTRGWATSDPVTVLHPPASAPSLSLPATNSTGGYTIRWGGVSGASRYTLQQQFNGGNWGTAYEGAGTSKSVSGLTNGTYGYRIQACNDAGCGPWSGTQTVSIAIPPANPTGVYANDIHLNYKLEQLVIVWNAVSGASSYNVKNLRTGTTTNTVSTSTTVYNGYPPAPPDSYAVQACNAWACSAWVNADRRNVYPAPISSPSLSVPATDGNGNYTVSWGSVSYTSSYTLQQRVNGGSWHTKYSGVNRSKAFSGQSSGTYGYRVRACNVSGCGPWGSTHSVTVSVLLNVTGLTATVTREQVRVYASTPALVASDVTGAQPMMPPPPEPTYKWYVTANWTEATGATHYDVKVHNTANGTTHTYNVSTTYLSARDVDNRYVEVSARACNANGCTAWVGPVDPTVEYY